MVLSRLNFKRLLIEGLIDRLRAFACFGCSVYSHLLLVIREELVEVEGFHSQEDVSPFGLPGFACQDFKVLDQGCLVIVKLHIFPNPWCRNLFGFVLMKSEAFDCVIDARLLIS